MKNMEKYIKKRLFFKILQIVDKTEHLQINQKLLILLLKY